MSKYDQFLWRNGLEDTPDNKKLFEELIRQVNLFLSIQSIKAIGGNDNETV